MFYTTTQCDAQVYCACQFGETIAGFVVDQHSINGARFPIKSIEQKVRMANKNMMSIYLFSHTQLLLQYLFAINEN